MVYQKYVVEKKLLTLGDFIKRSSSQTAEILGLEKRGKLVKGYKADVIVFNPKTLSANADFSTWNKISTGIDHVMVNGELVIHHRKYLKKLAGKFVH